MATFRMAMLQATISRYMALGIGFMSSMVLARLLLPGEIGVYSVGAAIVTVAHVLRDMGVAGYIIREPELSAGKLNTCFTVSLVVAWTLGALLLASAELIAGIYAEPDLEPMLVILSGSLFIVPFNSVRLALLRRDMRARILLFAEIASASTNAAVATTLAFFDYGPECLAWGTLASIAATGVVVQCAGGLPRVGLPSLSAWRGVLDFAGKSLGVNLIIRAGAAAPELIIGKSLGMHEVAILSRAMTMTDLFNKVVVQPTGQVAFAEIARQYRQGGALGDSYRRSVVYLSALALPCYGFTILLAVPMVRLLFGPNWDESAALLQVLATAGLAAPFWAFLGSFLVSVGRIDLQLRIEALSMPVKICTWFLAAPWGLMLAAQAFVMIHLVTVACGTLVVTRLFRIPIRAIFRAVSHGLAVTGIALLAPAVAVAIDAEARHGALLTVGSSAVGTAALWLLALFTTRHPLRQEIVMLARVISRRDPRQ